MTSNDRDVQPQTSSDHPRSEEAPRQFDRVCGMDVDPNSTTVERIDRKGVSYYFCSADCRRQFESSPEEYAA